MHVCVYTQICRVLKKVLLEVEFVPSSQYTLKYIHIYICTRTHIQICMYVHTHKYAECLRECYGVATCSRLLKIIGLFCRLSSLLQGSFTKETYNFKEPTNRSHPILEVEFVQSSQYTLKCIHICIYTYTDIQICIYVYTHKYAECLRECCWRRLSHQVNIHSNIYISIYIHAHIHKYKYV